MKRKPVIIVASLIVANFLAQLMQTMLNTALPQMMLDLGIQVNRAQWLITVYLLVSGIVIPCDGIPDRKILDENPVFRIRWDVYDRDANCRLLRRLHIDPKRTNY